MSPMISHTSLRRPRPDIGRERLGLDRILPRAGSLPSLLAALAAVCLFSGPASAASSPEAGVDQLFARWNRTNSPGAAIVVVKEGAVAYEHGYGCADLDCGTPITPETVFDAASVAKQFTGLTLAMLIEQGKISLDDDVRQYLPEVPDFGKTITVGQLLHHTAGLRDWPETLSISGRDLGSRITLDTILDLVRRQRELDFPPGDRHAYSNTGYNLLAAIVAKVTGKSFRAWTEENLFQPLGMKQTHVCDDPDEVVPGLAQSYAPTGRGRFRHVPSQLAAPGSSSLMITAHDMGRWLLNFEYGKVGGKAGITAMQQPGKLNNGNPVSYAFGIVVGDYRHLRSLDHTGGWAGYRSAVLWIPERRLGVSVLANAADVDALGLARKAADLYLGLPETPAAAPTETKPASATPADRSRWKDYLGTYRLGPGWLLTITRERDQLMAQATRESRFPMTPVSERKFFVEAYGSAVEFPAGTNGQVTELLYRGIHAPRVKPPEATPEYLNAYTGDYWSEELRVAYRLEIRDGQLQAWHPLQGWLRLIPTEPDRFDTDTEVSVVFTRDSDKKVRCMLVSGGRVRNLRFARLSQRLAQEGATR